MSEKGAEPLKSERRKMGVMFQTWEVKEIGEIESRGEQKGNVTERTLKVTGVTFEEKGGTVIEKKK